MRHIQTFEQRNTEITLNEGVMDFITKNLGKFKSFISSKLSGLNPEKKEELKAALEPFRGLSFQEIKQQVQEYVKQNPTLATESKINEYSEPRSDNHGRPSVDSYSTGRDAESIFMGILGITGFGGLFTGIISSLIERWTEISAFGSIAGWSFLVVLASMLIFIMSSLFWND